MVCKAHCHTHSSTSGRRAGWLIQTMLVMRLTGILLVAAALHVSARGTAQTVTYAADAAPLTKVFAAIEQQTGYIFFYNNRDLQGAGPVTVTLKAEPLQTALQKILQGQPVSFDIQGNTIVITRREKETPKPPSPAQLTVIEEFKGKVSNERGEPLAGATVAVLNSKTATVTDGKGMFLLKNIPVDAVLEISFTGYQKRQVKVNASGSTEIVLKISTSSLDEVQIIAYGTTTKRLNTGDVTTVTSQEIERQPVSNPILALEGRVPGMFIQQLGGLPGSASAVEVQIRGQNSLLHPGDPLYIVDGVPYVSETLTSYPLGNVLEGTSGNPFNFLNPADIESIDVLKDADATAIYGSRGANGVILITTKKGKEGNVRINMNVQDGVGQVGHKMKLLNTSQYLGMRKEAFKNDGVTPNPNVDYDLTLWNSTRNTNWQKELIGGTSEYKDIQTSVSGGNATTQFLIGGAYHKETTVFRNDWNDSKGSVHFSINNSSINKKLKILLSGNYIVDDNYLGASDPTYSAMTLPPDAPPVYAANGTVNWAPNSQGISTWPGGDNPIASMLSTQNISTNNLVANAGLSYQILPGLDLKATMGYTNMQNSTFSYEPFASLAPSTWPYSTRLSRFGNNKITTWIIEPQSTYVRSILHGTLTVLLGTTIEQNKSNGQVISATGFSSDLLMQNILAATSITPETNTSTIYKYNALFGRLNYNWCDKYILDLNVRRDGSSRFGPANRFANFYSVGGAWIFSKERFIQNAFPALSFGKLRGSYGTTGNDQVGDYTYLDLYTNLTNIGVPYQGASGLRPVSIYTPNLQWELTRKLEGALELGFWKDRVLLSGNYYLNRSSNQLVGYSLPSITGFTSVQENLPAVVKNYGYELVWTTVNIKSKDFRWTTSFNISSNHNLLASITKGMGGAYQQLVGHPIGILFLYKFAGVNPITGYYQFQDSHGDLVSTPNPSTDKRVAVNTNPRFFGGLQNSLTYRNFQLDFLFQFVKRINNNFPYYEAPGIANINEPATVLSRWQKAGDVTDIQRFGQGTSVANSVTYASQSDETYKDNSYIRLKNISLTYTLPRQLTKKVRLQQVHLFVHVQNLLTFTKFQGPDPESPAYTSLPPLRVVTGGISVTF
jgi:TonB-linked SusC/RagA family outer membrane protein